MRLERIWLTDIRSYEHTEVELAPGLTAVVGPNGQGKTNLLEAMAFLATLESFRGAPAEAMIRRGASRGVIRGEIVQPGGRRVLVECELSAAGRARVQVNRQRLRRSRDLLGVLRTTVFAPDDLDLVKGGPAERRRFLDTTSVQCRPAVDGLRADVERATRQRNALLRQVGGTRPDQLDDGARVTLDVWDAKLAEAGDALGAARGELVGDLEPLVAQAYRDVAEDDAEVALRYVAPWRETGLAVALAAARPDELRRGVTLVGPHRDELEIGLHGLGARTHASQGEQRTLALALRLAAHRLVAAATGTVPLLLLDDVFSELDPRRADALVRHLPPGQTVLTTASGFPETVHADRVLALAEVGS